MYPIIWRVLYIPGGAGFLPSTVSQVNWKRIQIHLKKIPEENCQSPGKNTVRKSFQRINTRNFHVFKKSQKRQSNSLLRCQISCWIFWTVHFLTAFGNRKDNCCLFRCSFLYLVVCLAAWLLDWLWWELLGFPSHFLHFSKPPKATKKYQNFWWCLKGYRTCHGWGKNVRHDHIFSTKVPQLWRNSYKQTSLSAHHLHPPKKSTTLFWWPKHPPIPKTTKTTEKQKEWSARSTPQNGAIGTILSIESSWLFHDWDPYNGLWNKWKDSPI